MERVLDVVVAGQEDCIPLVRYLSLSDERESALVHPGSCILSAVLQSLTEGPAYTVIGAAGTVGAMFGVVPGGSPGVGTPWLLHTEGFLRRPRERRQFIIESLGYIMGFHREYPLLCNLVSRENKVTIRWLKWLGFVLEPTAHPDILLFKRVLSYV